MGEISGSGDGDGYPHRPSVSVTRFLARKHKIQALRAFDDKECVAVRRLTAYQLIHSPYYDYELREIQY